MNNVVAAENTKKIATWMGYKSHVEFFPFSTNGESYYITINDEIEYNPITNAEQSREIEKKLLGLGYEVRFLRETKQYAVDYYAQSSANSGETLELAIYAASLHEAKK